MIWLASTPHSPQTERKRLAILAGFAFLTGSNRHDWDDGDYQDVSRFLTPHCPPPPRPRSRSNHGLCHLRQSQVRAQGSDGGGSVKRMQVCVPEANVCLSCHLSIIVTAFMGTSVIFVCFTLSALYAKRRSYLFLGGAVSHKHIQTDSLKFLNILRFCILPHRLVVNYHRPALWVSFGLRKVFFCSSPEKQHAIFFSVATIC